MNPTSLDLALTFSIPDLHARGRLVRLGPVIDAVLGAHRYPPPIHALLAEALVVTALLGSLLKDQNGQLTMQAQSEEGIVQLLVCDYRDGALRGYVQFDAEQLAGLGANLPLSALFTKAYLAITFDLAATDQRYQGIIPLEGDTLASACEAYFWQSEQVPSLLRVAVQSGAGGTVAAGLLLQHLAEGEEGRERLHVRLDHPEWEHVAALAGSLRHSELVDPALGLDDVIWRLFHEERVLVTPPHALSRGCRCSAEHYREVLSRFPAEEQAEMRNDDGIIAVDCQFCAKQFAIEL